jgi:hypothetical protein
MHDFGLLEMETKSNFSFFYLSIKINLAEVPSLKSNYLALTRASGLGLGASGVGFGLLRQREDLGVSRCGHQEDGK